MLRLITKVESELHKLESNTTQQLPHATLIDILGLVSKLKVILTNDQQQNRFDTLNELEELFFDKD